MSDLKKAAQQALRDLERAEASGACEYGATDALRTALAQQEQEPYCYVYEYDSAFGLHREFYPGPYNGKQRPDRTVPVYTHPPRREPEQEPVADAMKTVIKAMQADPDYAWSWHCNVAMAFVDAGGNSYTANQGAARFMRLLANVEPAHELPSHPPRREWQGLTEEEIDSLWRKWVGTQRPNYSFTHAIEQALKEKNQ